MDIDITIGEYEVLNTGSIIAIEGLPIKFTIGELTISFLFSSHQGDDTKMTINKRVISQTEAEITFENFDSQLGSGLVSPYVVGRFRNREFSFMVRFSQLNRGGKLVNYTWLVRDIPQTTEKGHVEESEQSSE